jgi:protein-disulfide isomerase
MGLHSGVKGTPTFFIDGQLYEGPVTADALVEALNRSAGRRAAAPTITIRA